MIELVILVIVMTGYHDAAKKRGTNGIPFILAGVIGYFVLGRWAALVWGPGPHLLVSWGWVALCYALIFGLTKNVHIRRSTWQCPDCRLFNEPSTLVCPCGHPAPEDDGPEPAADAAPSGRIEVQQQRANAPCEAPRDPNPG